MSALRALHAWLDNWRGVGLIVEGMRLQGYRVSLRVGGSEASGVNPVHRCSDSSPVTRGAIRPRAEA